MADERGVESRVQPSFLEDVLEIFGSLGFESGVRKLEFGKLRRVF